MSLTGRAAVLGIVLLILGISFAYPLRNYFGQRAEIAGLQAKTAAQEQSVTDLQRDIARWNDPAYVKTIARERLHFVMPGDTLYVVLNGDSEISPENETVVATGGGQWWQRLWTTVEEADAAGASEDRPADVPAEPTGPTPSATPTTSATTTTDPTGDLTDGPTDGPTDGGAGG